MDRSPQQIARAGYAKKRKTRKPPAGYLAHLTYDEVLAHLEALGDPRAVPAMAKYGITPRRAFGTRVPHLRELAYGIGTNHGLAGQLWDADIRETRILAGMVADPDLCTPEQMDAWAHDFDYWEVCDQCCMNLFERTRFAYQKCLEWSACEREFVKRAGFVLMARLAVGQGKAEERELAGFLSIIRREAKDDRKMVRLAVNWALRQIGKHSDALNRLALATAEEIAALPSPGAQWIAADATRELTSAAVRHRLRGE